MFSAMLRKNETPFSLTLLLLLLSFYFSFGFFNVVLFILMLFYFCIINNKTSENLFIERTLTQWRTSSNNSCVISCFVFFQSNNKLKCRGLLDASKQKRRRKKKNKRKKNAHKHKNHLKSLRSQKRSANGDDNIPNTPTTTTTRPFLRSSERDAFSLIIRIRCWR